jgi:hypothetical protein
MQWITYLQSTSVEWIDTLDHELVDDIGAEMDGAAEMDGVAEMNGDA